MEEKVTEIQIVPVKPKDGLVAFASFLFDDCFYLGSIGIYTRPQGGFRLCYPTKRSNFGDRPIFYPIKKDIAKHIEDVVIKRYEEIMGDAGF